IFSGVIAQEATISVNQAIVVKPTPNPLTDPADRVDITLQCIGSRTDLSYYIKNQITWEFKDHKEKKRNLTTGFYPAESSAEYFRVDSGNPHYDLTYTAEGNGFKFALKIIRIINWSFTSTSTRNVKKLSMQSFSLESDVPMAKYNLLYEEIATGYAFTLKISGINKTFWTFTSSAGQMKNITYNSFYLHDSVDETKHSLQYSQEANGYHFIFLNDDNYGTVSCSLNDDNYGTVSCSLNDDNYGTVSCSLNDDNYGTVSCSLNDDNYGTVSYPVDSVKLSLKQEIHLMMNGEKYSGAPTTMKSIIDNQRPSYMKKIDKMYDLTHREMEQVLSCEANIPGEMYQPQVASMKLKVQIVKPTIDCENITRSIGDNYVPIECTITSQSDVMCEMVSWQFADRNEVITLGEAVKDPEQKYDIVKAECTSVDEKTAKTTLTIYKANAAHFKAVYYVNYGVGEDLHRHPVSINLDTTISGSNLIVPLSMLVYIVMAAVSKLL
ncbi:hypothetical protein MAR_007558, partial [Mya arenaria]